MSIIVLGTSNCIVRDSAIHIVRAMANEEVINVSVGSSPTSASLYLIPTNQIRPGDVAILDYAIPDSSYIGNGLRTISELRAYIRSIVSELVALGCKPVMLLNPEEPALQAPPLAEIAHVGAAREMGVPVFNVSAVLRDVVKAGRTHSDLMIDAAHQSAKVTAVTGKYLYQALMAAREMPSPVVDPTAARWKTRVVPIAPLVPPESRIERSSSLRSAELAVLGLGERLNVAVGEDEQLIGFMTNMGAPGGKARFTGAGEPEVLTVMAPWANRLPESFMSVFADLKDRPFGSTRGVLIESVPDDVASTRITLMWREVDLDLWNPSYRRRTCWPTFRGRSDRS
jgi:hypothetical protein